MNELRLEGHMGVWKLYQGTYLTFHARESVSLSHLDSVKWWTSNNVVEYVPHYTSSENNCVLGELITKD